MREIKFRAWDNKEKVMHLPETSDVSLDFEGMIYYRGNFHPDFQNRFIPLQYTGLEDKNGKEIYEGDIIRESYSDGSGSRDFLIEWKMEEAITGEINEHNIYTKWLGIHFKLIDSIFPYTPIDDIIFSTVEVIGNKFENPELLK